MFNINYESAKVEVERLIERFARLSARNRRGYNEPATRQEFILPLFRALGWNIEDTREVSPEERVSRGYVDFAFRLRGIPRFFVETKKIPEDLEAPRWARQAINYAWLKGVTWAVLTDFEGLKVFNAEWQETLPARAIFKDLYWDEYLDRFDDLWLLSRPAMEEGALDRAAEAVGKKAKKTPVSRQLFADLTEWRRELFRHLRPYNPKWSIEQIDQAVQRILDRLIFIRTCEDREIEPYRLRPMLRQWRDQERKKDLVKELNLLFREFDRVYDTRLFAPHLCEELSSEPTPFEQIIEGLYQVPSGYGDYDFNAIDADVMGTIYEQYLGHRAQDPEGKQVVDRRAKRKAQGIYYTPQFVVRYIVGQTLGRLLEERDYEQARRVKVLDMACGSGSFLIEAFDVLDRYLAGVRGQNAASAAGDVHDFARRMEILTGNLYGVDLDAQAVEIARLNLLLRAVNQQGELPELTNIRQGNSLISGRPEELEVAFGSDWRDKQPFDWEEQFSDIMERGGFDVIVGNPPYVRTENIPPDERAFFSGSADFVSTYKKYDIYVLFIERGLRLLREGGYLGFIIPYPMLNQSYAQHLRRFILDSCSIEHIIDLAGYKVFQDATVATCIIILRKESDEKARRTNRIKVTKQATYDEGIRPNQGNTYTITQAIFSQTPQMMFRLELRDEIQELTSKVRERSLQLGQIYYVSKGIVAYSEKDGRKKADFLHETKTNEKCVPYLEGRDIRRYRIEAKGLFLEYDKDVMARPTFRELHESPKLLIRAIGEGLFGTFDHGGYYADQKLICCVQWHRLGKHRQVRPPEDSLVQSKYDDKYTIGLINSRLLRLYYSAVMFSGLSILPEDVRQLPIRRINFDDPEDVARHDRMVGMVEEMLRLQKEHAEAEALKEDRRHDLARRIERLDAQIDELVYELYGLTEEEVGVVEGRGV